MKKIPTQARDRNGSIEPDIFSWRQTPPHNVSRVALHISRRFGISLHHASTIVCLAGIGGPRHES